jgi:adenylate cyclase
MTPTSFSRAMNRFCAAAIRVINETDGFILDVVGDEVEGVYPPGFSGQGHARKAVLAAEQLLGLAIPVAPGGPLLELGVGVHSGIVYIGTMSGVGDEVRATGDNVNTAARLSSVAQAGEALISDTACSASGLGFDDLEHRSLDLKGKSTPVPARVMRRRGEALARLRSA